MNADRGCRILLACLLVGGANAQMSLEGEFRCTGEVLMRAFEPQRAVLQSSSAVILDGRTEAGYGVVVSADGHILVKASEFAELKQPQVIIDKSRYEELRVLATDRDWDVTLIQVAAQGLIPVEYAPTSEVARGTWVVSNGATSRLKRRALAGVISATARELPPLGGLILGAVLKPVKGGLQVESLVEGTGAAAAGIAEDDLLTGLDGKALDKLETLVGVLADRKEGDRVKVQLQRDGKPLELEVELMARDQAQQGQSRNDQMSGDFSRRRSGFPRVLQHSILGNSRSVGGPLLDLDGRCLGMNIARATRAESFAIPAEELRELAGKLMAAEAENR